MTIKPSVAALGCVLLIGNTHAELETPVEEEIARAVIDPCESRLEVLVIADTAFLSCPGCTALQLDADDDSDNQERFFTILGNAPAYERLIFLQLLEAAAGSAGSIFSDGMASISTTARHRGLCGTEYDSMLELTPDSHVGSAAARALSSAAGRIRSSIEANWRRPGASLRGLKVVIELRVGRNGEVQKARIVESSGDDRFDESAELAVQKASPLPIPKEPEYFEHIKEFRIEFNPDE